MTEKISVFLRKIKSQFSYVTTDFYKYLNNHKTNQLQKKERKQENQFYLRILQYLIINKMLVILI